MVEIEARLNLLGDGAQFDVSAPGVGICEAMRQAEEAMRRTAGCIFPAQVGGGRCMPVFKVLMSNECRNDCFYCGTRCSANIPRATFQPEELVRTFLALEGRGLVKGLFLSSGVRDDAERAQEQMIKAVEILRKRHGYRGYIHLKVLPGVSDAAVEAAARLAGRLSINLEAPTVAALRTIAPDKEFRAELLRPLETARALHRAGMIPSGLTTQFVVGGAGESDRELLTAADWLYEHVSLRRAYYSAFRPIADTPLEGLPPTEPLREHRLYQADFLLREYGFALDEVPFGADERLPATQDPKEAAARLHPERFPVEVNAASREELLRVPGIGPTGAGRILAARRERNLSGPRSLALLGMRAEKARDFLTFNGRMFPSAGQPRLPFTEPSLTGV